uniref:Uncharacterized protein n=1 Tax=Magallana gigas TaxID=29159 RepID=K1PL56_MAGGI
MGIYVGIFLEADQNVRTWFWKNHDIAALRCSVVTTCVGSFGINCSGRCVDGFYGFGCLSPCNCSEDQICDSRDGCMEDKKRQYEENLYHLDITSTNLFTLTRRESTHLMNIKVT